MNSNANLLKLFIFASLLLLAMVIKAIFTPFTYDEAYSFLHYALPRNFISTGLANNHPLNSIFLWLNNILFGDGELSLRLGSLLAGLLYLSISIIVSLKTSHPLFSFALLGLASPYLIEFFSLARGYGFSAAFVAIAMSSLFYDQMKPSSKKIYVPLFFLVMAAFSIYTSVIILFVMGALTVISLIRSGQVQRAASVATFIFAASIPPVLATRSISEPGKPLYGAADFLGVFSSSYSLLSPASPVLSIAVAICLCIPFFMKLSDRSKMLLLILVLTLFIFYVAAFFAGRPLPTGRVLLPLIPIFLLASVSAWDDLLKQQELSDRFNFRTLTFNSVRILVLVVLTLNFILSFRFDDTHDWKGNRVNPEDLMQSIKNGECSVLRKYHPSITFYQRKWQDNIDSQCSDK